MGSFNLACGVSNIIIGSGDKVRLIFIAENKGRMTSNCHCYPTDLYYPISFAIPTTYDDCASFNVDEKSLEWLGLRTFLAKEIHSANVRKEIEGKNNPETGKPYQIFDLWRLERDIPEKLIESLTAEKVFEKIHNDELKLSDGSNVTIFPVHQTIWDKWAISPYKTYSGNINTINTFVKNLKEALDKNISARMVTLTKDNMSVVELDNSKKRLTANALYDEGKYNYSIMDYDYPWLESIDKDYELTLLRKSELFMFLIKMDSVFKLLTPQQTASQDNSLKEIHELHSICAKTAKEIHNKNSREMGYTPKLDPKMFIK